MIRLRAALARLTPTHAMAAALVASLVVLWYVGRDQWFIRDDWAFLLSRERLRQADGVVAWLSAPQDGHWMAPPLLLYRLIRAVFGIDSYAPYLAADLALHVAIVLTARHLARQLGASAASATAVCVVLLVFGNGWENLVFAVQVTYNLSLLAFLVQLVLVHEPRPVGRRDAWAGAVGVIGVSSSGFGPFFVAALAAVLLLQRRWRAAAVVTAPAAVVYGWWFVSWASDAKGKQGSPTLLGTLRFVRSGIEATLIGMTGQVLLAGVAAFGLLVLLVVVPLDRHVRSVVAVLTLLPVPVLFVIGWQRAAEGLVTASASRYQYMSAIPLAVPLALAVDQLRRLHPRAVHVGWALLALAAVSNARILVRAGDDWADRSARSRRVFELVAASVPPEGLPPELVLVASEPDVTAAWLPTLVAEGVITPRPPADDAERELVARVLAGIPEP